MVIIPCPSHAAVIVAGIWKGCPFYFVMILAGLQSIPREIIEAAQVDGANRGRVLVSVEMPYIRNILAVTSVLGLIWTANYFDGIYLMTQGGPIGATLTLPIWIYNTAFSTFNLSEASALSVILLIIVLILTIPRLGRERREGFVRGVKPVLWEALAIVVSILLLVPFLWTILESFHGSDVFAPTFSAFRPTVSDYRYVLLHTQIPRTS